MVSGAQAAPTGVGQPATGASASGSAAIAKQVSKRSEGCPGSRRQGAERLSPRREADALVAATLAEWRERYGIG